MTQNVFRTVSIFSPSCLVLSETRRREVDFISKSDFYSVDEREVTHASKIIQDNSAGVQIQKVTGASGAMTKFVKIPCED